MVLAKPTHLLVTFAIDDVGTDADAIPAPRLVFLDVLTTMLFPFTTSDQIILVPSLHQHPLTGSEFGFLFRSIMLRLFTLIANRAPYFVEKLASRVLCHKPLIANGLRKINTLKIKFILIINLYF